MYERMTVRDHIAFFVELHGRSRSDATGAARRWSERLELPADAAVASLSKGNQQRVQLASALAHDPELVILDEPFSGLDPIGQEVVETLMTELAQGGATLLLSSHDLERVERFCSYVASSPVGSCATTAPSVACVPAIPSSADGCWSSRSHARRSRQPFPNCARWRATRGAWRSRRRPSSRRRCCAPPSTIRPG